MNLYHFTLSTSKEALMDITDMVKDAVSTSGITSGICLVYCPHTTAGITINENADPDVVKDILFGMDKAFPVRAEYKHFEGNSHAHLKSGTVGCSTSLIIEKGNLILGRWQGIYFCEFDGPRTRNFYVKIIGDKG